jgi:hypothetical protein
MIHGSRYSYLASFPMGVDATILAIVLAFLLLDNHQISKDTLDKITTKKSFD